MHSPPLTDGEQFPELLNRWLELTALSDLAQRERHVRTTLRDARASGWDKANEPRVGILDTTKSDFEPVIRQGDRWAAEVDELQRKLTSFRPAANSTPAPARRGPPHRSNATH